MPQIILKERTAYLASYTFLRDVDQYKTHHFHSSINHQEHLFHRALITSNFCLLNISKFLRAAFLWGSRLQMFVKIGILKTFANFT